MNTGKQDRKIKFISIQGMDDGYGGTVPGRTTLLETFAQVNQIRSSSSLEELQNVLNDAYRFTVKWRSGFDPSLSNVIEYNGIDLTIQQVELNNERMKRFWTVMAINTQN
jgi:hypothetical protein